MVDMYGFAKGCVWMDCVIIFIIMCFAFPFQLQEA